MGAMYGPDLTFLGVPRCDLDDADSYAGADVVILGAARQLLDAVRRCAYELPVVGLDVVEVSPPYDHAEITAYLGNRVVLETLSAITRRRRDAADHTIWDPRRPLLDR